MDFDELLYDSDLLDYIQYNIVLLEIVDSYFKIYGKECSRIKKESFIRVYPDKKFFYDCCPFHYNSPNYPSFFVDGRKELYYCFGCGAGGSVFEFVSNAFSLDINETTELLGAMIGIFKYEMLNNKLKKYYCELKENYGKQNHLIEESIKRTEYLNKRIENYLKIIDLENINFEKVANRLCCSEEIIIKKYYETDYHKQKMKVLREQECEYEKRRIFY